MESVGYEQLPSEIRDCTLRDIMNWKKTGVNCIGIKTIDGKFVINPPEEVLINKGMKVIVLGTRQQIEEMKAEQEPIEIVFGNNGEKNYIYYKNSLLIRQLRYYPYFQLAVISLFLAVSYLAFSTSRKAEQTRSGWVWLKKPHTSWEHRFLHLWPGWNT